MIHKNLSLIMLLTIKKALSSLLLLFTLSAFAESNNVSIVIHGGAGWFTGMAQEDIAVSYTHLTLPTTPYV